MSSKKGVAEGEIGAKRTRLTICARMKNENVKMFIKRGKLKSFLAFKRREYAIAVWLDYN